jgi:hypothetical protein
MIRRAFQEAPVISPALKELLAKPSAVEQVNPDMVNHPAHYTFGKYEVIAVLQDWFPTAPLLWQVVKYVARAQHKGNMLQDLRKAQFYLDKQIAEVEK